MVRRRPLDGRRRGRVLAVAVARQRDRLPRPGPPRADPHGRRRDEEHKQSKQLHGLKPRAEVIYSVAMAGTESGHDDVREAKLPGWRPPQGARALAETLERLVGINDVEKSE